MPRAKKTSNLKSVESILERFDFESVYNILSSRRTVWQYTNATTSIEEMRRYCRGMLLSLCEDPKMQRCSKQGFEACWIDDKLYLRFMLIEVSEKAERNNVIRGLIVKRKK